MKNSTENSTKNATGIRTRIVLGAALVFTAMLAACGGESLDVAEDPVASIRSALTCSGTGCNGVDPALSGCSADGITVKHKPLFDGTLELRWSKTCQTNWARVQRSSTWASILWLDSMGGELPGTRVKGGSTVLWSNMWYAPDTAVRAHAYATRCSADADGCDAFQDQQTDYR